MSPLQHSIELYLEEEVNRKLLVRLQELKHMLGDKYPSHLSEIESVIQKFSYRVKCTLRLDAEKKTRRKKYISPEQQCLARTGRGSQCRRPRVENGDGIHCLSHMHSLPCGDITEILPGSGIIKRRGRKSKGKHKFTTEDLDSKLYVQAVLENIDGQQYLVDEHKMVYRDNLIVGYIDENEVCWF